MSHKWHLFRSSGGISSSPRLFPSVMTFLAISYSSWSKASVWNILSITPFSSVTTVLSYQAVVGNRIAVIVVFHNLSFSFDFTSSCSSALTDFIHKVISSFMLTVLVGLLKTSLITSSRISLLTSSYALFKRLFVDCTYDLDTLKPTIRPSYLELSEVSP